jgi:hypothetical protein
MVLPKKIVFSGSYTRSSQGVMPFLMIYDRENKQKSVVKLFKSHGEISCLGYGPYDNGHILVGTSTGDFLAFDSIRLSKLCCIKLADFPVTNIAVEWTQLVLVGVRETGEVTAVSFIEQREKYLYMEMSNRKYATVVISKQQAKALTTSK